MIIRFIAVAALFSSASTSVIAARIPTRDLESAKSRPGRHPKGSLRADDSTHRRLLSKSSKSSKGTKLVCLSFGEQATIKGTDEEQTGPVAPTGVCDPLGPTFTGNPNWDSEECVHYEEPFFMNADVGSSTTFVFDDGTDYGFGDTDATKPPLGDGALCGSTTDADDKVEVTYIGDITDPMAPVADLQNEPAEHLESIKYSFWVQSCITGGPEPCANEFYLNVYTRSSATSMNYYDCRFDFVPTEGGAVGAWTTFDLNDIKNVVADATDTAGSGCNGATTIQEVRAHSC